MLKSERKKIIDSLKREVEMMKNQLSRLKEDKKKSSSPKSYIPRIETAKKNLDNRKNYLKAQKEALKTDSKG